MSETEAMIQVQLTSLAKLLAIFLPTRENWWLNEDITG